MKHPGVFLGALMALLMWTASGCGSGASDGGRLTPAEIRGVWITSDSAYADRAFEVLDDALIFHTGEGGFDLYVISVLRRTEGPDGVAYEIEHHGREGGQYTFSFTFRPSDTTITFRNQPGLVWSWDRELW